MKKMMLAACSLVTVMFGCTTLPQAESYMVNSAQSSIGWKGYLTPENFNHGTFAIDSTTITTKNGQVTGGSFVIPIASINVINLDGPPKEQFLHHLKSEDFFHVLTYPKATFSITTVTPHKASGATGEMAAANYMIRGTFTMLGIMKEVSFPAHISIQDNKLSVAATFTINRLDYGMKYASDPKGELYILPDVALEIHLEAAKK